MEDGRIHKLTIWEFDLYDGDAKMSSQSRRALSLSGRERILELILIQLDVTDCHSHLP